MAYLFSKITLRGLTLPNRIVVSPMDQYCAENGNPVLWHQMHYSSMAISGAGLVVFEGTAVEAIGRISPYDLGLYSDENETNLKHLVSGMKSLNPQVKIGLQLSHAGRRASSKALWDHQRPLEVGGWQTVAPSALPYREGVPVPLALDEAGMSRIKQAFINTAERAARCGFDLIEFHCCHEDLLDQFLSPTANIRTDRYGGSLENRMRFPLEVIQAVRETWPDDKPLGVRINQSHGMTFEEMIAFAKKLPPIGVDFICSSSGGWVSELPTPFGNGEQADRAKAIKDATGIPVRAVGMIVTPDVAEHIIASGRADLVAIARAFEDDPRWGLHAAEQLGVEMAWINQLCTAAPSMWPASKIVRPPAVDESKYLSFANGKR